MPGKTKKNKSDPEGGMHGTYTSTADKPAEKVIKPKGTRTSELRKQAVKLKKSLSNATGIITGAAGESSKGSKKKEPVELFEPLTRIRRPRPDAEQVSSKGSKGVKKEEPKTIVSSETTTHKKIPEPKSKGNNTLVASKTMTIKQIQQRLNSLIQRNFPMSLIDLISNNHETIKKEFNSGNNTEIINLVAEAADVVGKSQTKTTYAVAKEDEKKEFLEVVDSARKKKKLSSEEKSESNEMRYSTSSNLSVGDSPIIPAENDDNATYKKYYFKPLQLAVNDKNIDDIVIIMTALIHNIETAEDQDKQLHTDNLHKAIEVTDSKGNTIFQILNSHKNFDEHKATILDLFNNFKNVMPNAMEVLSDEGETLVEIVKESGNKETDSKLLEESVKQLEKEVDSFCTTMKEEGNNTQTTPQSPIEPIIPSKNLDEPKGVSDDSGMGLSWSPGSSTSSSTESLNAILSDVEESGDQEFVMVDYSNLRRLNPWRQPNLNSRLKSTSSGVDKGTSDEQTEQQTSVQSSKEPIIGADEETNDLQKAVEKEKLSLGVIPVHDTGIQEKQKKIPASSAGMTSTSSEKPEVPIKEEPAPGVSTEQATKAQEPAVIPEQIAKNPIVIRVADTGIKGEENQIPVSSTGMTLPQQEEKPISAVIPEQVAKSPVVIPEHNAEKVPEQVKEEQAPDTGMTEDNARGQMVLSHQEETPDNEDNESQIEQQTTLSNEDNNEGALFTKQSSNKTSYTTIAIGCAVLAVGCFVAAVIIQSLALLIIGALLVTGAGITSYLTPSTQVESMEINAHVNVEQTL